MKYINHYNNGMTLVEILLGIFVLAVAGLGIFAAMVSQNTLNQHAYNLTLTGHDANRILEQIRRQNSSGCTEPSALVAGGWDAWMEGQSPGKSSLLNDVDANQLILVTCTDEDGGATAADVCGPNQVSSSEWWSGASDTSFDPIRVTVSVCWRHNTRVIGECTWDGSSLSADDADSDGVIDSPVMLTSLVTCRG